MSSPERGTGQEPNGSGEDEEPGRISADHLPEVTEHASHVVVAHIRSGGIELASRVLRQSLYRLGPSASGGSNRTRCVFERVRCSLSGFIQLLTGGEAKVLHLFLCARQSCARSSCRVCQIHLFPPNLLYRILARGGFAKKI